MLCNLPGHPKSHIQLGMVRRHNSRKLEQKASQNTPILQLNKEKGLCTLYVLCLLDLPATLSDLVLVRCSRQLSINFNCRHLWMFRRLRCKTTLRIFHSSSCRVEEGEGEEVSVTESQKGYGKVTWRLSGRSGNSFRMRRIQLGSLMMKFCLRSNFPPASCTDTICEQWLVTCLCAKHRSTYTIHAYGPKRSAKRCVVCSPSPKGGWLARASVPNGRIWESKHTIH